MKLSTTLSHISSIPNLANANLVREFYDYLRSIGTSENYQNQNLKQLIVYARYLGTNTTFYDIKKKEEVLSFLDTRTKSIEIDADKKWITTWNDYLWRIKYLFRWIYNYKVAKDEGRDPSIPNDWITPSFASIKKKKTKRVSPYLETELWDRDELLAIIKYEPQKRNKAALSLLWDLDARPHEVTLLKIKHIRLRERYGEGEIPHDAKTGSGPVLLTCSFPYVRDWLNEHPFRNEPNARLICNLITGSALKPDSLCSVMNQLRERIIRIIESDEISDNEEREKLASLVKSKKWLPYCIRHSAITADSDYLPEYALKKKVRWSMNSKQGTRYIKRRMGNELKEKILVHNGIMVEIEVQKKITIQNCPRCGLVNAVDCKYCSKCSYPLVPSAFDEIKLEENKKFESLEQKLEKESDEMALLRKQLEPLLALKETLIKEGLLKELV